MAASTSSESPKQVDGSGSGGGAEASAPDDDGVGCAAQARSCSSSGSPGPNDAAEEEGAAPDAEGREIAPASSAPDRAGKESGGATAAPKEDGEEAVEAVEAPAPAASGTAPALQLAAPATKKDPQEAAGGAKATPPTYESVQESELYRTALGLMKEGEFEDCIELVEQGIDQLRETLLALEEPCQPGANGAGAGAGGESGSGGGSGSVDVHPSMAPYYYLYGTALLYKVEEHDLNNPVGGGVGVSDAAAAATAAASSSDDDQDDEGRECYGGGPEDRDDANNDDEDAVDKVEDLQVAWEFLEAARGVLERMIATAPAGDNADKYRADLAQVRLREGDVNRINGQSQAAAADYQASLEYLAGCAHVGPYHRKVADLHYNLGLLYTLEAAAAASASAPAPAPAVLLPASNPMVAALLPEVPPPKVLSGREKAALRGRGVYHYWQCCRVLAGRLAILGGVEDPNELLERAERTVANLKSTGEGTVGDEAACDFGGDRAEHPTIVSRKLTSLRADLALHLPSSAATGKDGRQEQTDSIAELVQLLDDIQETIDEVERSEEGIQQVTEMKAEISAAAAATNAGDESGHGFGSAAAAASSAIAQPLLAVKKKAKKRDASEASLKDDRDQGDSKRPAAE